MVPVVDLVEIGNGGGSIAWVDDFGKLHVGPQSAGAMPGPAAYGRGGDRARRRPTPTSRSAASTRTTSAAARSTPTWTRSTARSTRSRAQLGVDRTEAARGVVRIANNNMINALKLVSRQPRLRPARLHARRLRRRRRHARRRARSASSGSGRWSIPRAADVFSAWGMLMSDLRRDYFVTRLIDADAQRTRARLDALLDEMTQTRARPVRGARASARSRCVSSATATSATRTRSTASRCRCPTARSTRPRSS